MTEDRQAFMRGPNDEPHPWPPGEFPPCGRRPWLYYKNDQDDEEGEPAQEGAEGVPAVYIRKEPLGSGPLDRFLFPQLEARTKDRRSRYKFAVAMTEWFAGSTAPLDDVSELAKKFARIYGNEKWHMQGLHGRLWNFSNRHEFLREMIEEEQYNPAYHAALLLIRDQMVKTNADIPPELKEWYAGNLGQWSQKRGFSLRKDVLLTDASHIAYTLVLLVGLLHSVVKPKFALMNGDNSDPYSICGAVAKVMQDRGFEMDHQSVRKYHSPREDELEGDREVVREHILRSDRNGIHGNDVAILKYARTGRLT